MTSETLVYFHTDCLLHDTGKGHPESANRVKSVLRYLQETNHKGLVYRQAPRATTQQLSRVHPSVYTKFISDQVPDSGRVYLDPDTPLSKGSKNAALCAAGAVCAAVDEIIEGQLFTTAFCLTRPPGHHAEPTQAMGFCVFNNVAIGATHARHKHGIQRLAIVDFDVHHGNGTQKVFESDPDTLYVSSHEFPLFPGTGHRSQTGAGNIVNIPLVSNTNSNTFRQKWKKYGLPVLQSFAPEAIFISAGFDGHKDDPLASIRLAAEDYGWLTREIVAIAKTTAQGRVISSLEGGYEIEALCRSCAAHLYAMKGK